MGKHWRYGVELGSLSWAGKGHWGDKGTRGEKGAEAWGHTRTRGGRGKEEILAGSASQEQLGLAGEKPLLGD